MLSVLSSLNLQLVNPGSAGDSQCLTFSEYKKSLLCEPLKVNRKGALMERYESYTIPNGNASIMWSGFRNVGRSLYGQLRKDLGQSFENWHCRRRVKCGRKAKVDHVHMVVSIPPKYSVAQVIGMWRQKCVWVARATGRIGILWVRTSGLAAIVFQRWPGWRDDTGIRPSQGRGW